MTQPQPQKISWHWNEALSEEFHAELDKAQATGEEKEMEIMETGDILSSKKKSKTGTLKKKNLGYVKRRIK